MSFTFPPSIPMKKMDKTSQKDALRMIEEEMPDTDAEGTLRYILTEIQKGKAVTLGESRFRATAT